MKKNRFNKPLKLLVSAISLALPSVSLSHDTDIFTAGGGVAGVPNILFVIDNSANWDASMGSETQDGATRTPTKSILIHDALFEIVACTSVSDELVADGAGGTTTIDGSATDPSCPAGSANSEYKMNMGLMLFSNSNSPRGAKVMRRVEDLTASSKDDWLDYLVKKDETGQTGSDLEILELFDLNSQGTNNDYLLAKANNAPYANALQEAYRYYMGEAVYSGAEDGDHDTSAIDGLGSYISPIAAGDCGDSYVIFLGNGSPDNGENSSAETALAALGGSTETIDLDGNKYESSWADETSRFMANADTDDSREGNQSIVTYVVDIFNPDANGQDPLLADERGFLESIANQGDGKYYQATDAAEVTDAIKDILDEILAINTAFAATALPVSVNVRGTNLNQVYIGVFRPDSYNRPLWPGNLKMYTLGINDATGDLQLEDKNGLAAENTASGFINSDATSFWSVESRYWDYSPRGILKSGSDAPDGEVVEKGGVGQRIRSGTSADRNLLTFTNYTSGTAAADVSGEITTDLYSWLAGEDAFDENGDGSTTDMRPYSHGDVIHSQPAIVNYNTYGDDDSIVVFYGSNDGLFRAIEGGPGDDGADHRGNEIWGITFEEHLSELNELYYDASDESVDAADPNTSVSKIGVDKPYFVDGGISVYLEDAQIEGEDGFGSYGDIGDTVDLYIGMRRGGRFIYALDVNDSDNPKMLWTKSYDDRSTAKDDGFSELGETWSKPIHAVISNLVTDSSEVSGYRSEEKRIILMGAGYDPDVDDLGSSSYSSIPETTDYTMGRGIYALDALTGDIIAFIGAVKPLNFPATATFIEHDHMLWSIPSDLTVIDRDRDGYVDRLYVGDTGGHLWRVDLKGLIDGAVNQSAFSWDVSILGTIGHDEKFLYPPDVVDAVDDPESANPQQLGYDAVLIGTGDRENPFDTAQDYSFYMFKDQDVSSASPGGGSGTAPPSSTGAFSWDGDISKFDLTNITNTATAVVDSDAGWYFTLDQGEKVVSNPVTLSGVTYFNTHTPASAGSCDSLGIAKAYSVRITDGQGVSDHDYIEGNDRFEYVPGGGLLPSPVPGIVEVEGSLEQVVISGTHVSTPVATELSRRYRVSRASLYSD